MDWKTIIEEIQATGMSQAAIGAAIGKSQAWVGAVLAGQYKDIKWSDGEALRKLHAEVVGARQMPRSQAAYLSTIRRAFELCGGPQAVMGLLGIGLSTYYAYLGGSRGKSGLPPEHCVTLEAHLAGQVTRRDLRPDDWWLIWPELVDPDHPPGKPQPLTEREGDEGAARKENGDKLEAA